MIYDNWCRFHDEKDVRYVSFITMTKGLHKGSGELIICFYHNNNSVQQQHPLYDCNRMWINFTMMIRLRVILVLNFWSEVAPNVSISCCIKCWAFFLTSRDPLQQLSGSVRKNYQHPCWCPDDEDKTTFMFSGHNGKLNLHLDAHEQLK